MADEKAGPSSLKGFINQLDRDRSLQQDRLNRPNGGAGPSESFRSSHISSANSDGAFDNFQAGLPLDVAPRSTGPMLSGSYLISPNGANGRIRNPIQEAIGPRLVLGAPGVGAGQKEAALTSQWVNQFGRMGLVSQADAAPSAADPIMAPAPLSQDTSSYHPMLDHGPLSYAQPLQPSYVPIQQPFLNNNGFPAYGPISTNTIAPAQANGAQSLASSGPVLERDAAIDEAFNVAFQEFDENDFQSELDDWMAQNGPHAEALRNGTTMSASMTSNLNQLANDTDARRAAGATELQPQQKGEPSPEQEARDKQREQDELARAALEIINSVSSNTSEKFRNSSFFDLMRKIRDRQVIVEGDNLVDSQTGETVVTGNAEKTDVEPAMSGDGDGDGKTAPRLDKGKGRATVEDEAEAEALV